MSRRKQNKTEEVILNEQSDELVDKVDRFTQKVENKINILLIVPSLISRLFNGVGSIFTSLGDAFDISKPNNSKRSK